MNHDSRLGRNKHKGDLKANLAEDTIMMNSYDVVSLHIPYGPGWHARRINKLVYQTVRLLCYAASNSDLFIAHRIWE
jgi:hypothetical protein